MLYTTRKIKDIKACQYRGYLSQFNYNTEQNQFLHLLSLTKKCIKEGIYNKSYDAISDWFDGNVDPALYIFEQQKDVDRKAFVAHMKRFGVYLRENNGVIIDSKVSSKINILGEEVLVKADFVIQYNDKIELVKISNSKPKLSYNARSDANKPENNFELFLMQLLGRQLYPLSESVSSAFYHMVGKFDEKETYERFLSGDVDELWNEILNLESEYKELLEQKKKREANKIYTVLKKIKGVVEFDGEKGSHIIRQSEFNNEYILNELTDVFNVDLNEQSEKCVGTECDNCQNYVLCKARQFNKVELEVVEVDSGDEGDSEKPKKKDSPTDAQLKLINSGKGKIRTSAIPGGGKSFSIVYKFAKLLKENNPQDILMITFTNLAAQEMKERVYKLTENKHRNLHISTFNSFGMSLVENEWEYLGYTSKPQLINKIDKIDYIKQVLSEDEFCDLDFLNYKYPLANLPNFKGAIYTMYNYFNQIKAGMFDEKTENKELIYKMYDRYNDILKENNQLEYDDQLLLTLELLKDKDMLEKYGFKFVIVDEYNDVNLKQVELLQILEGYSKFESLTVVGDINQSIYRFRLSSPEYMLNFDKYFGEHEDIFIQHNFRSHSEICDLANKYIRLNEKTIHSDMISVKGEGGIVEINEYDTLEDEYKSIVSHMSQNNDGKNFHEYAVIGRTSKELLTLQKMLDSENIPSRLATPQKFMDNHNVRICINLAKYLKSDDVDTNDYYLFEYVSVVSEETNKDDLALLISQAKDVIINLQDENYDKIEIFRLMIEPLLKKEDDIVASTFINNLLNEREWYNFTDFESHLSKHVLYSDDGQMDKDETEYNAVVLTTYHSSKGLEFEKVFLLMDKFDYDPSKDIDDVEEQRRLFYVGVTRSVKELYMVYNINMDKSRGKGKYPLVVDEVRRFI